MALGEALRPEFADYAARCVANAQALADRLAQHGFDLVSGGTDNHLVLLDLRNKESAANRWPLRSTAPGW